MIKKLSNLDLYKRAVIYLSLLLFIIGVFIAVAIWVPIHFELEFDERYACLFFSTIIITGVFFLFTRCISKLENKVALLEKEPNKQEFLEVAQVSYSHWAFTKYKGDRAIYAVCPHCNFRYNPSVLDENLNPVISSVFKYCPMCAEYLYVTPENIKVDVEIDNYISNI